MSKVKKVPVSERALMARLNRKLQHEDRVLKKCRAGNTRAYQELGDYYIIGYPHGGVDSANIDLESWARDYGVLADYEELVIE